MARSRLYYPLTMGVDVAEFNFTETEFNGIKFAVALASEAMAQFVLTGGEQYKELLDFPPEIGSGCDRIAFALDCKQHLESVLLTLTAEPEQPTASATTPDSDQNPPAATPAKEDELVKQAWDAFTADVQRVIDSMNPFKQPA